MAGAKIGALHVSLGLDSASFSTGLRKAETGLGRFGKSAGVAFAAVATAAAAAGTALGFAVKAATDHADTIGKTAQRIGVTTEALSRLEYAARLSDVSLEGLSTGMIRLSANLSQVAQGSAGPAAVSLQALGIAATETNGKLRNADEVLADVADRFARMEDSSLKTSLAVNLFGRAGADLIPLLNSGRDGLADMAAEADRLGITISGRTSAQAQRFNDQLTRISAVLEGVGNKVAEAALPALNSLADTLASPAFAEAAGILANNIIGGLNRIIEAVTQVIGYFDELERRARMEDAIDRLRTRLTMGDAAPGARTTGTSSFFEGFIGEGGKIKLLDPPENPESTWAPTITALGKVGEAAASAADQMSQIGNVAKDSADKSAAAMTMTSQKFFSFAGEASSLLGNIFGESKQLAVAQAVLSAGEGIARTMGAYPFPYNIGLAGLHAAAAMAQIQTISSTTANSSSYSGGVPSAVDVPSAPAASGPTFNVSIQGDNFSRQNLIDFFNQMQEQLGDSGKFIVTGAT